MTSPLYLESSSFLQEFREKTTVIPATVNPYFLTPIEDGQPAKESFGFSPKNPLLLFVGRLVPYKGLQILLQAFKWIHDKIPTVKLAIVGSGPLKSDLQEQCANLELSHVVHFLGVLPRRRLRDIYSACDIFVLPSRSRSEAFGIVQLEAMARGKPVVATTVGGVPYVVKENETGLLVPPVDSMALAKALTKLLENTRFRHRLGQAGRKRVIDFFTRKPTTQKLEDVYFQLLA